jgi:hypothetical protein
LCWLFLRQGLAWCWASLDYLCFPTFYGWQVCATVSSHCWDGVSLTFFLGFPWTMILLIPAFHVDRVMNHHAWLALFF